MKYICNILLALILAMLINYLIVRSFAHMKKPDNEEILSGLFSKTMIHNPTTKFTHQTKRYDPPSSSSGHSGGGHSGGGGGHSGGGHSI